MTENRTSKAVDRQAKDRNAEWSRIERCAVAEKYQRYEELLQFLLGAKSIADHYKNHIKENIAFDPLAS